MISRLRDVCLIVDDIKAQSQDSNGNYETSLGVFSPHIEKLVTDFATEYDVYHLDEIVVGAIAPIVS